MKRHYYFLIVFLLLLIITNPSVKAFKDYKGVPTIVGIKRISNAFVFSLYQYHQQEYIGVVGNFWNITPKNSLIDVKSISKFQLPYEVEITYKEHELYTIEEFANLVKKKYPEYDEVDSYVLTKAVVKKIPYYKDFIFDSKYSKEFGKQYLDSTITDTTLSSENWSKYEVKKKIDFSAFDNAVKKEK